MNIQGKVISVSDYIPITETFSKRMLLLQTEGEYSQLLPIEFNGERGVLLNDVVIGSLVEVYFNLRARNGIVSIVAWRVGAASTSGRSKPPVS